MSIQPSRPAGGDAHTLTEHLLQSLLSMVERCRREMVELSLEEVYADCLSALSAAGGGGPSVLLTPRRDGSLGLEMTSDPLPFAAERIEVDPAAFDRTGRLPRDAKVEMLSAGVRDLLASASGGRESFVDVLLEDDAVSAVLAQLAPDGLGLPETTRESLQRMAGSIRLLLRAGRQFQALLRQVAVDPLTGLYNQRYFLDRLRAELSRASRYGHPLSLLFIDLDDFQACNRAWGSPAADAMLGRVADLLRSADQVPGAGFSFRRSDVPVRHSGEELAILLPETPKWGALTKAERLRRAIEGLPVPAGAGPQALTASIGVSAFPGDASDATSLIDAAVRAMQRAKLAGKNRVEPA